MFFLVFQRIFFEAIFDALYLPIWWYAGGVKHAFVWCLSVLHSGNEALSPGLWLKNIFVPMFGQYDIQGRIISFFMRLFQVVARSVALLIWFIVCLALFVSWFAIPVAIVWGMINSFSA